MNTEASTAPETAAETASPNTNLDAAVRIVVAALNGGMSSNNTESTLTSVFHKLEELSGGRTAAPSTTTETAPAEKLQPAVPIRKSITPDALICLEDGKSVRMLKRYLMTQYGLTPDQYRAKWGLKADYPMVAPNYSEQRRALAHKIGLGRKRGEKAPTTRKNAKKAETATA